MLKLDVKSKNKLVANVVLDHLNLFNLITCEIAIIALHTVVEGHTLDFVVFLSMLF